MIVGFQEFEFDLPEALLERLVAALDSMDRGPLTQAYVSEIPEAQGVYQLFYDDQPVYIGKTDAEAGLRSRLDRHAKKIQHRKGLNPDLVAFKAVRIFVFTAIDLETQLLRHYGLSSDLAWNGSGFGANDPGINRDLTEVGAETFDALYPVDIDRILNISVPESAPIDEVLRLLRGTVPYTVRIQAATPRGRRPHPDLIGAKVVLPKPPFTARTLLTAVVNHLPAGWQATALAGRVILYKTQIDYAHGEIIQRS